MTIALGGQSRHALDDPGRLRQRLQILANPVERARDVEVIDADQLTPAGIEEDQLAERTELQSASEPRAHAAGRLRHAPDLDAVAGAERAGPSAPAEPEPPDHHGRRPSQPQPDGSRNPNSWSARSPRRQCRPTSTVDSKNTLTPKNDSRSRRAAVPIRFSMVP